MKENYRNYIRFDWAAKRILRDKANFSVLEGLVSVLLNENVTIKEILESESNADQSDSKFNRVDIMAKNSKDQLIIVEIQLSRHLHYLERILFGVGKAISDNIARGEAYAKVKKVYSISILYFDFGTGSDYVYHGQTVFKGIHTGDEFTLNEHERYQLGMRTPEEVFPEYYLIRVNEFNQVATTPLEEWIEYLKTGEVREGTNTPGLRDAKDKLDYMNMTDAEQREYDTYLDNLRNEQECLESARMEGIVEGRAEGRAEGIAEGIAEGSKKKALEVARRLLSTGMDIETVASITDLPVSMLKDIKN